MSLNHRQEDISQLLLAYGAGKPDALNQLMPLVYDELKCIARNAFAKEGMGHTLQPTALVNQAYEKLLHLQLDWRGRTHFFAISARIIRRMLVDHARAKVSDKRGGQFRRTLLRDNTPSSEQPAIDLINLDRLLEQLAQFDERKSKILELVYFAGLTYDEIAQHLNISQATVDRDLRVAKAWLNNALHQNQIQTEG